MPTTNSQCAYCTKVHFCNDFPRFRSWPCLRRLRPVRPLQFNPFFSAHRFSLVEAFTSRSIFFFSKEVYRWSLWAKNYFLLDFRILIFPRHLTLHSRINDKVFDTSNFRIFNYQNLKENLIRSLRKIIETSCFYFPKRHLAYFSRFLKVETRQV